jgi:hypothetical protein
MAFRRLWNFEGWSIRREGWKIEIWVGSWLFHIGLVGLGFGLARLDVSIWAMRFKGRGTYRIGRSTDYISFEHHEEWVEQDRKGTHGRELFLEELNIASCPLDRTLFQVAGIVYQSIKSDLPRLTNSNP